MGIEKYKTKKEMTNLIEKPYKLPIASADELGGIKVGTGFTVSEDGTASVTGDVDIVDNVTSTATNKALSANQGRVLKGLIDDISIVVPEISTDIEADATSDTKTASPKAVKTYVDSKSGAVISVNGKTGEVTLTYTDVDLTLLTNAEIDIIVNA